MMREKIARWLMDRDHKQFGHALSGVLPWNRSDVLDRKLTQVEADEILAMMPGEPVGYRYKEKSDSEWTYMIDGKASHHLGKINPPIFKTTGHGAGREYVTQPLYTAPPSQDDALEVLKKIHQYALLIETCCRGNPDITSAQYDAILEALLGAKHLATEALEEE